MTTTDGAESTQPSVSEPIDLGPDLHSSSTLYSLSRAVHARKAEYVRPHRIRIKVGSWNVAACPGTDKDIASWFVQGKGVEPRFDSHLADQHLRANGTVEEEPTPSDHDDPAIANREDSTFVAISRRDNTAKDGKIGPDTKLKTELATKNQDGQAGPQMRLIGGTEIGLYVLGLQEIISLNIIAGYTDTSATAKWQAALEAAMPPYYKLIASQQLSGLLLLLYASPEVADTITNVSTVSVGTGLMGYMGNKGAVSTRIVLGETTRLVFTNSHLASGHDQANLERRFWDYNRILSQTQFAPINIGGALEEESEKIGEEDVAFWFGDLNFRLDGLPGDDIRRLLMLHTRGEYDVNNKDTSKSLSDEDGVIILHNKDDGTDTPGMVSREASFGKDDDDDNVQLPDPDDFVPDPHDDPASLQATLDSLLPHDQLSQAIKERKAFHEGWREGPITFLPSYKYDIGTVGLFDSSEKRRAPSWCDRILYRTRREMDEYKSHQADQAAAKKKDDDMKKRGIDAAGDDESVLFDYNPDIETQSNSNDVVYDYDEYEDEGDAESESELVVTKEGFQDRIRLDLYTTHQRITSSDHKPIVALFALDYDAVVPELKAKVHAEVARDLDRAENEGRPVITIVVDGKEGITKSHDEDVTEGSGGVDFGNVGFMRRVAHSLTIANTGRVPATLCFVEKANIRDDEAGGAKLPQLEWLTLSLQHSSNSADTAPQDALDSGNKEITLEPGDTASALLTISIGSIPRLQSLNEASAYLEDVLVLRVSGGRDHFLPIHASWLPSCFGRSIEQLIRLPPRAGGIRGFSEYLQKHDGNGQDKGWTGGSIPDSFDIHASSPTELYKLIEAIEALAERAVADENMLQGDEAKVPRDQAGWPFSNPFAGWTEETEHSAHYAAVVDALETDNPRNIIDTLLKPNLTTLAQLQILANVLLLFISSLTEGIVTPTLFAKIETVLPALGSSSYAAKPTKEVEDDKSAILDILSAAPHHNISFVFVTSMLSKLAAEIAPLNGKEVELLNSDARTKGKGRSLSFRKSTSSGGNGGEGIDERAIQRRLAWERKVAEVMGRAMCRFGPGPIGTTKEKEKERKTSEDRMRGMVELFLRRRDGG